MSETYCGLLNVLVLGILAAANGYQIRLGRQAQEVRRDIQNGQD